jgi:HlyD family secretion protein
MNKYVWLVGLLGIGAIGGSVWFLQNDADISYDFAEVERGDIFQDVAVTGRVQAVQEVQLSFEISGKVSHVLFGVGDRVAAGQPIVQIEDAELQAELAQAEAEIQVQNAVLAELEKGTRAEEIEAAQKNLENVTAQSSVDIEEAYVSALTAAQNAVRAAKNSLLVLTDIQFAHFLGTDFDGTAVSDAKEDAVIALFGVRYAGKMKNESLNALAGGVYGDIQRMKSSERRKIDEGLVGVLNALKKLKEAFNVVPITSDLTSVNRSDLASEKSTIDSEIVSVSGKEQAIFVQKAKNAANISAAEQDLRIKEAGTTPEEVDSQRARVESAKAHVQTIRARLEKARLISPIAGVVIAQEAKKGEIVQAGEVLVSVISQGNFEIEAFVPEADIAKIGIGNQAALTLDAYGDEAIFLASLVRMDPAETIIEGVPTYKVTLHFEKEDERIRSGMTANIDIRAHTKSGVLVVPSRAVFVKEGKSMVRVVSKTGSITERGVTVGLVGSQGTTEIAEGVEAGEQVITFMHD